MQARPNDRALLALATQYAAESVSLAHVARKANDQIDLDLPLSTWRGIWKRYPKQTAAIRSLLGTETGADVPRIIKRTGDQRVVVLSDAHAPHHDPDAIAAACDFIRDVQPTIVILNGDLLDLYAVSSFDKDPDRVLSLQYEFDICKSEVLDPVVAAAGEAELFYVEGNHEHRLTRWLSRHPEVASLRALSVPALLDLDKLGIKYVTYGVEVNDVLITHGKAVAKWSGGSIKRELERQRFGVNMVMGHVHRVGLFNTWTRTGGVWGIEAGCLCNLNPDYVDFPDWSHGLAHIETNADRSIGKVIPL